MDPDTLRKNQQLTSSAKEPSPPALRESDEAQNRLDELIAGSFLLQKLYGKQPENIAAVNQLFHSILGGYPSDKVLRAFETWLARSQEFPTPADIIGLIRRNGRPPLSEAQYVAISRKDGADRTPEEWQYLRDFEADRDNGWGDTEDTSTLDRVRQENVELRETIIDLRREHARLANLLHEERLTKGIERPRPSVQDKVQRTIDDMRRTGASEEDIAEFARQYRLSAAQGEHI